MHSFITLYTEYSNNNLLKPDVSHHQHKNNTKHINTRYVGRLNTRGVINSYMMMSGANTQ